MIYIYILALFSLLPIFAYVLSQKTINKGYVFGISFLIIIFCIFSFSGKYSFLGSVKEQNINAKILLSIDQDVPVSDELVSLFDIRINEDEKVFWAQSYIFKAISEKKLNSAESLISMFEKYFKSSDEKFLFYTLYTQLRDAKFPIYRKSKLILELSLPDGCKKFQGNASLFIMNGPKIPIASKDFLNDSKVILENTNSSIPGFDLASAYLNQESIELKIFLECEEITGIFTTDNVFLFDQNMHINQHIIQSNEWLKKTQ